MHNITMTPIIFGFNPNYDLFKDFKKVILKAKKTVVKLI